MMCNLEILVTAKSPRNESYQSPVLAKLSSDFFLPPQVVHITRPHISLLTQSEYKSSLFFSVNCISTLNTT